MKIRSAKTGRWSSNNPNYSQRPQMASGPTGLVGMTGGNIQGTLGAIGETGMTGPDPETQHPLPRRREAIEHTRRKLGL